MWQIQQTLHQKLVGFTCKDTAVSINILSATVASAVCAFFAPSASL